MKELEKVNSSKYSTDGKTKSILIKEIDYFYNLYFEWIDYLNIIDKSEKIELQKITEIQGILFEIQMCWNLARKRLAEINNTSYHYYTIYSVKSKEKLKQKITKNII